MKQTGAVIKSWQTLMLLTLFVTLWTAVVGGALAAETPPPFLASWGSLGNNPGQFAYPYDVAVDAQGNLYVVSWNQVQKFTPNGAFLARWGGVGGTDGLFQRPSAVAIDSNANVYIVDTGNARIQKFDTNGQFLLKWGDEGGKDGEFQNPSGIAVDANDHVYVVDQGNNRIQKFDGEGVFLHKWGEGEYGVDGKFWQPQRIAVDGEGNVYVTDRDRIEKFDGEGNFLTAWGSLGSGEGEFSVPWAIAADSAGNVYVTDWGIAAQTTQQRVLKFSHNGTFLTQWGFRGDNIGEFDSAYGIVVHPSGNIYVADTGNHRIQVFGDQPLPTPTPNSGRTVYLPNVKK